MTLFFDTSAFLKRYIDEMGSSEVSELCLTATDVGISILLPIEALSTFSRLKREKRLNEKQYIVLKRELFADLRDITVVSICPKVVTAAIGALEHSVLKSLDAIHIACALEFKPDFFVSGDVQQIAAAKQAGLGVKEVS